MRIQDQFCNWIRAGLAAPGFVPSPPRKRKLNWSWRGPLRAANKIKQVQNADEEWCLWHPVASHGMSHGALPLESFRFTSVTRVSDPSLPYELCSQHRSDFEPAGNTRIMKKRRLCPLCFVFVKPEAWVLNFWAHAFYHCKIAHPLDPGSHRILLRKSRSTFPSRQMAKLTSPAASAIPQAFSESCRTIVASLAVIYADLKFTETNDLLLQHCCTNRHKQLGTHGLIPKQKNSSNLSDTKIRSRRSCRGVVV